MGRVGRLVLTLAFVMTGCSLGEPFGPGAAQQPPAHLTLRATADLKARSGFACLSRFDADVMIPSDLDAQVAAAPPGWLWEATLWIGTVDGLVATLGGRLIGEANGFAIVNYETGADHVSDMFREQDLGGRRTLMLVSRDRAIRCERPRPVTFPRTKRRRPGSLLT